MQHQQFLSPVKLRKLKTIQIVANVNDHWVPKEYQDGTMRAERELQNIVQRVSEINGIAAIMLMRGNS